MGVEVQLHSFFHLGAKWGWVVNPTPCPLYPLEGDGNHCVGGWVDPSARLDGCGELTPTGLRQQFRPSRSESLYRLSCPSPQSTYEGIPENTVRDKY